MAQILLPDAYIDAVGWSTAPLFSKLDEPYPAVGPDNFLD